jgi:hypothetical protein
MFYVSFSLFIVEINPWNEKSRETLYRGEESAGKTGLETRRKTA